MPYYDLSNKEEKITLKKLLENYKYLEYITNIKYREDPSMELFKERRGFRNSVKMINKIIKKKK